MTSLYIYVCACIYSYGFFSVTIFLAQNWIFNLSMLEMTNTCIRIFWIWLACFTIQLLLLIPMEVHESSQSKFIMLEERKYNELPSFQCIFYTKLHFNVGTKSLRRLYFLMSHFENIWLHAEIEENDFAACSVLYGVYYICYLSLHLRILIFSHL